MAKELEQLREQGLTDSYSPDEALGITVNHLMFRKGITRKKLGEILGVTGVGAGSRLRGETRWTLADIFAVAEFFNVDVAQLLPRRAETPAQLMLDEGSDLVAGTGFEPVTSGL